MELSHEEIKELLPSYALGAVDDREAAAIRDHILGCETCMQEADELEETSRRLAVAVPGEPLPPGFSDRVMAAALEGRVEPAAQPQRSRPRWLFAAVGGAALFAIAAVMTFQVVELQGDRERQDRVLEALASDSGVALTGEPGVRASVIPNGVGSVFAVSGLDKAPSGMTYQLWLIDESRPVSAGTFEVEDGIALVEVAQPIEDYSAAAVTIERAGGAEQPTTEPILSS
jgi:anti-sigma-K factor RskA